MPQHFSSTVIFNSNFYHSSSPQQTKRYRLVKNVKVQIEHLQKKTSSLFMEESFSKKFKFEKVTYLRCACHKLNWASIPWYNFFFIHCQIEVKCSTTLRCKVVMDLYECSFRVFSKILRKVYLFKEEKGVSEKKRHLSRSRDQRAENKSFSCFRLGIELMQLTEATDQLNLSFVVSRLLHGPDPSKHIPHVVCFAVARREETRVCSLGRSELAGSWISLPLPICLLSAFCNSKRTNRGFKLNMLLEEEKKRVQKCKPWGELLNKT